MEMYKKAAQSKLRFNVVNAGVLAVEHLFTAKKSDLILTEELLEESVDKLGKTSKRRGTYVTKEHEELQLKLSIITDVIDTLEKQEEESKLTVSKKENNQKIMALITAKKEGELQNKSIEELQAMLQ